MLNISFIVLVFGAVFIQAKQQGFFYQITDLHYDPWYHTTQESCNENLTVLGKYGDFECDAPWELVRSSIKGMVDIAREAEFILWTGDNAPHAKNQAVVTQEVIMEIAQNITNIIKEFFPDTLVIPVLGNHDIYPKNNLPGDGSDMYDQYADMWDTWLNGTEIQTTFRKGAYFTLILSDNPKVRGVVLNTNLYLTSNSATDGQEDPGGQFAWFDTVMNNARQQGEKVHIFTHVPLGKVPEVPEGTAWLRPDQNAKMAEAFRAHADITLGIYSAHSHLDSFKIFYGPNGNGRHDNAVHIITHVPPGQMETIGHARWMRKEHNSKLHNITVEFGDIILGYYSAHSHLDTFRLFFNSAGEPVASLLIPPSVSPWRSRLNDGFKGPAHNPGLRKYTFSKSSYELLDVQQYYLHLEKANSDLEAEWQILYSFANAYGLSNISTPELNKLLNEMKEFASDKFHLYYDLNTVSTTHPDNGPCSAQCKYTHLCAIEFVDYDEFDLCLQTSSANNIQHFGLLLAIISLLCNWLF